MIRKQNLSCLDLPNWDVIWVVCQLMLVNVGERQITQSLKVRDLGVTFDQFLNFDDHITAICRSTYFHIRNIGKSRNLSSYNACSTIIHALISCWLDYCNSLLYNVPTHKTDRLQILQNQCARILTKSPRREHITPVWGNALSTHTQPLIKWQNKIIRIITNSYFLASSEKLYSETGILPFVTLVKYWIGLLMFKIAKLTVPISISRLFKLNSGVHNYNTRLAHHIHSFKGNNEFIYRTFKFQSVYIWNSILKNININVSFPTFKHLLKRLLLNNNTSVRDDK